MPLHAARGHFIAVLAALTLSACDAQQSAPLELTSTAAAQTPVARATPSAPPAAEPTIDGHTYRRVDRDHFTLGNWSIRCLTDRMSDERMCHVLYQEHTLSVLVDGKRIVGICAFKHDFPGRRAALRIDGGKPIDLGVEKCSQAGGVGERLAKGKRAIVRWVEWPHDVHRDDDVVLDNVRAAVMLAQRVHRNEIK